MIARLDWVAETDVVQRAARVIALQQLELVADACSEIRRRDAESIHAFRVALRRLRSWLRIYGPCLDDTVRKRTRRRLHSIADATNSVRDLDVQIEWLRAERHALGDSRFAAAAWVLTDIKSDRKRAWRRLRRAITRDFPAVERGLRDELATYVTVHDVYTHEQPASMREASARLLRDQAETLAAAFGRIRSADDGRRLHRARIAAKRSRYVLEELARHAPAMSVAADELARFQSAVGELRDAQMLAHRVSRQVVSVAAERTALVASELVYRPTGAMDFTRVVAASPFDTSLSLLFARLHDRIASAAQVVTASLDPGVTSRMVQQVEASAALLRELPRKDGG